MVNESFKKFFYDLMNSIFAISVLSIIIAVKKHWIFSKKETLRKTNILIVSYLKFAQRLPINVRYNLANCYLMKCLKTYIIILLWSLLLCTCWSNVGRFPKVFLIRIWNRMYRCTMFFSTLCTCTRYFRDQNVHSVQAQQVTTYTRKLL